MRFCLPQALLGHNGCLIDGLRRCPTSNGPSLPNRRLRNRRRRINGSPRPVAWWLRVQERLIEADAQSRAELVALQQDLRGDQVEVGRLRG